MEYKLIKQTVKEWIHTANWHNIVIYLIFVVVSTLFWFMMKLNEEIQLDYRRTEGKGQGGAGAVVQLQGPTPRVAQQLQPTHGQFPAKAGEREGACGQKTNAPRRVEALHGGHHWREFRAHCQRVSAGAQASPAVKR